MITGFNTDIQFNGKVYHVQTEDRGRDNPLLETLVYVKGQILDALRTSYAELLSAGADERRLAGMLEAQHKRVIRSIKNGRYDAEGVKPFGHGIITDRHLGDVVLEFVQSQAAKEKVEIQAEPLGDIVPGWTGALRVTLRTDLLGRPVGDCGVVILHEPPEGGGKPVRLFQGKTDAKGTVLAEITPPDVPGLGELRIVALDERGEVELRLPLRR
jgi:hypothetical protein